MNRRYSAEGVEKVEHLYCYSGHSLKGVAELNGVPLTTLKRWSGKNGWVEKKSEIGRALIEVRTNTVLLCKRIMESVSIRYHVGPIRRQNGIIPVSSRYHIGIIQVAVRYHSGSIPAPSRQRRGANGLSAGTGFLTVRSFYQFVFSLRRVFSSLV